MDRYAGRAPIESRFSSSVHQVRYQRAFEIPILSGSLTF